MYNYVIDAPPPLAYGYVRHLGQLCNALGLELCSTALGIKQLPLASYISIDPREGVHLSPRNQFLATTHKPSFSSLY